MILDRLSVERPRVLLSTALLLSLAGALAWSTMPRQEDPSYPQRDGLLRVEFPGAAPEDVERLVLDPIEDALAELSELEKFVATARFGLVLVHVKLRDSIYETDLAWDEVERAVAKARLEFPSGVGTPLLDRKPYESEAIVLALTGSPDALLLADTADRLRRELLTIPSVARVQAVGDPGEQIVIELDDVILRRAGVAHAEVASALAVRNVTTPAGSVRLGDRNLVLRPRTELESIEDIARTPIRVASGAALPLGALARVRRAAAEPPRELMRLDGVRAVGLSLTPKDEVDVVRLGAEVRRAIEAARSRYRPLVIHEVAFQPDHVGWRIRDLSSSLLLGIVIVTVVLCAAMGPRLGLTVAAVIPLVVLSSLALYAAGGGVLHQVSIAGLVLSLGLLVDNAIIVAEAIQQKIDAGSPPLTAAASSAGELALPLSTATATTLAAFVPLLLAGGMAADFIRSLPVVVMITLSMSFVFALLVTPGLAAWLLRRRRRETEGIFGVLGHRVGAIAVRAPARNLVLAGAFVTVSVAAMRFVDRSFFPSTDRAQLVIDVELPEGAHLDGTDRAARQLEAALLQRPEVRSVASFVGRSAPLFYYNLPRRPSSPHLAQLVIGTRDRFDVPRLQRWVRGWARSEMTGAFVVPRKLEQGRTVIAPVEIRISGESFPELRSAAEQLIALVRTTPGCEDVRHDLGVGTPSLRFEVDDASAQRHLSSRADVAMALLTRTRGMEVGQLRSGRDPVPILVRASAGEELSPALLSSIGVGAPAVPLGQFAGSELTWSPSAIQRRNRARTVTVYAQLAEGVAFGGVVDELEAGLRNLTLPESVHLEWGGEAEGSGEANLAIVRALPLGALLLILFVLAEFNSFRRLGMVLVTVPLAVTGVVPGLLLSGQPFGFQAFLGVVALLGIVVNNAIVLLDVIERSRAQGRPITESLQEAVRLRTRPILLTTITTVAGLLPLAFSSSPLWPPLAWTMISGLLASTALTLVVVPSMYACLFRDAARSS